MKRKWFGTDGIRGEYGGSVLNDSLAYRLGRAAGSWLKQQKLCPKVPIGRDTRRSGEVLLRSLTLGFLAEGVDVVDLGVLPTPGVAVALQAWNLNLGVVITASHNPARDNGIKFFGTGGEKFDDAWESEIEAIMEGIEEQPVPDEDPEPKTYDGLSLYLNKVRRHFPGLNLEGRTIVIDTANGATCQASPIILKELGACVIQMGDSPNGENINDGVGSEHAEGLSKAVIRNQAWMGIAHDGDGDRLVMCDAQGTVVPGETLLYLLAVLSNESGLLRQSVVVTTNQSNLGLDAALEKSGIRTVRTDIGDRYVLKAMLDEGYNLGGENSGHFILGDYNPTGDGLMTALSILEYLLQSRSSLSDWLKKLTLYPSKSSALKMSSKPDLSSMPEYTALTDELCEQLEGAGRLHIRYSGTEPKLRLLVEAASTELLDTVWTRLNEGLRSILAAYLLEDV